MILATKINSKGGASLKLNSYWADIFTEVFLCKAVVAIMQDGGLGRVFCEQVLLSSVHA
jgi:hypothetical protein